jgi:hypothetical protein
VGGFVSRTERVLKSNEGAFFKGDLVVGFDIREVLDLVSVRWAMGRVDTRCAGWMSQRRLLGWAEWRP